jgi:hypothetical protein
MAPALVMKMQPHVPKIVLDVEITYVLVLKQ